jgi:putative SOS response-associated peptidase YedK
MCGRFTLRTSASDVAKAFQLATSPELFPRYNIAPTQRVLAILLHDGHREGEMLHWGLIPSWAEEPSIGQRMINARAEGIAAKPAFRSAFRKSRCLIVADGFYEWKKPDEAKQPKQPYLLRMKSAQLFAFAGLAEHWRRGELAIDSCTIITTSPNSVAAKVHDRMPVILDPRDYDAWLNPESTPDSLLDLLRPCSSDLMEYYAVSTVVNSPRNESEDCAAPMV